MHFLVLCIQRFRIINANVSRLQWAGLLVYIILLIKPWDCKMMISLTNHSGIQYVLGWKLCREMLKRVSAR